MKIFPRHSFPNISVNSLTSIDDSIKLECMNISLSGICLEISHSSKSIVNIKNLDITIDDISFTLDLSQHWSQKISNTKSQVGYSFKLESLEEVKKLALCFKKRCLNQESYFNLYSEVPRALEY
jgi:hypothetical protein